MSISATFPPRLADYASASELRRLIDIARLEDLGQPPRDLTSELIVPAERCSAAAFRTRDAGVLAGAALLPLIMDRYDPSVRLTPILHDGQPLKPGENIALLEGPLRSLLAIERVALNLMTHLSGVASLTAQYVATVGHAKARICDTRKTLPGLRALEKYAVACGGGGNHRMGLHDAVLVKDNHIAHLDADGLAAALHDLTVRARATNPPPAFVEVEVDTLDQLKTVLGCAVDRVLLDNMPPVMLGEAVAMRDRLAPYVLLEASGGVNLQTVRAIAASGVDIISVGALTHSAPSLDIGLDIA